ncbi:MAG: hypothetical protein QNJ55_18215 [Xenococcus sp. MO_188.B8]|nr:hypothetical protein [Xenococcus sp. MO_188.B8]
MAISDLVGRSLHSDFAMFQRRASQPTVSNLGAIASNQPYQRTRKASITGNRRGRSPESSA